MRLKKPLGVAAVAALTCAAALAAAPASAESPKAAKEVPAKVTVLTKGLDGPRQLSSTSSRIYVAESDSGEITGVNKKSGAQSLAVRGVSTPQGVVRTGGKFYIASGEPDPESGQAPPPGSGSRVLVAKYGKKATTFANLKSFELRVNPDHQTQFDPKTGEPLDALSNPYFVIKDKAPGGFLLVADAGGNDVLKVSKKGKTSVFFVPPSVSTGACADQKQNDDQFGNSCDAVPTGLAYGPDGNLYISALTSLVPNEGRVYVVNRSGKLLRTLTGFSAPTGVAVAPGGTVYVSELLQGAPEGEGPPPAGFDPNAVGQIVKVAKNGARTYAQVTQPSGLLWTDGKLYASAWSAGALLGIPKAGQVVVVDPSSFVK